YPPTAYRPTPARPGPARQEASTKATSRVTQDPQARVQERPAQRGHVSPPGTAPREPQQHREQAVVAEPRPPRRHRPAPARRAPPQATAPPPHKTDHSAGAGAPHPRPPGPPACGDLRVAAGRGDLQMMPLRDGGPSPRWPAAVTPRPPPYPVAEENDRPV